MAVYEKLVLLIKEGCLLNKKAITDMINIGYGWLLHRLPKNCVCGQKFSVEHTPACQKGEFITIRHKEDRETTAKNHKN